MGPFLEIGPPVRFLPFCHFPRGPGSGPSHTHVPSQKSGDDCRPQVPVEEVRCDDRENVTGFVIKTRKTILVDNEESLNQKRNVIEDLFGRW